MKEIGAQKMLSDLKILRSFAVLILVLCLVKDSTSSSSNACCLSLWALNLQDDGMCCYAIRQNDYMHTFTSPVTVHE
jgi:hypothetical protein